MFWWFVFVQFTFSLFIIVIFSIFITGCQALG